MKEVWVIMEEDRSSPRDLGVIMEICESREVALTFIEEHQLPDTEYELKAYRMQVITAEDKEQG